ncbi:MAG: AAA family ATPase [Clostridia bacterium]|nr:AAA family ATPase [Clostridia bacterium]
MRLLILCGAQAVGKMTVGQALAKITPLKLFHNHMSIEPVIKLFGSYNGAAVDRLRQVVFEEFAKTDNYGMIFTYVWAFSEQADWDYVAWLRKVFEDQGGVVDIVELIAPQEVRLQRNRTENRLKEKPSKRDSDHAEGLIYRLEEKYRCVSEPDEIPYDNYLRLDNSHLSPEEAAQIIADHFGYQRL